MIPSFKDYFYPYMLFLSDDKWHSISDIRNFVASFFQLTNEELREKTKGGHIRHHDRVSWTTTYLKKMELISRSKIEGYKITEKGLSIFKQEGEKFSLNTIRDLEGFHRLQKKEGSSYDHWVPGHWTSTGRYIAGYVSHWEYRGRQRRFTKEELDAFNMAKEQAKKYKKIRNN